MEVRKSQPKRTKELRKKAKKVKRFSIISLSIIVAVLSAVVIYNLFS